MLLNHYAKSIMLWYKILIIIITEITLLFMMPLLYRPATRTTWRFGWTSRRATETSNVAARCRACNEWQPIRESGTGWRCWTPHSTISGLNFRCFLTRRDCPGLRRFVWQSDTLTSWRVFCVRTLSVGREKTALVLKNFRDQKTNSHTIVTIIIKRK